jgi:hypothetical protein
VGAGACLLIVVVVGSGHIECLSLGTSGGESRERAAEGKRLGIRKKNETGGNKTEGCPKPVALQTKWAGLERKSWLLEDGSDHCVLSRPTSGSPAPWRTGITSAYPTFTSHVTKVRLQAVKARYTCRLHYRQFERVCNEDMSMLVHLGQGYMLC